MDFTNDVFSYLVKEKRLVPGTRYYFTVTATNNVGLTTSKSSDGILVDIDKPVAGVIFNTHRHRNERFQSSTTSLSASWQGFDDHQSFIEFYSISLVSGNKRNVVAQRESVGLSNSVTFDQLNLSHGESYYFEMYAVDSVSHTSDISRSENVIIDTTSPEGLSCEQFNDSMTFDTIQTSSKSESHNRTLYTFTYYVDIVKGELYKLEFHAQSDPLSTSAILEVGNTSIVSLQFASNHDGTYSSENRFIAEEDTQSTVEVSVYTAELSLAMSKCENVEHNGNHSIMLQQISKNLLSISVYMVDKESGIRDILVGAGTTKGGYQVLPLTPITANGHLIVKTEVHHGSVVYPIAISTNYAGLKTTLFGTPIIVDHTEPTLTIVSSKIKNKKIGYSLHNNESLKNDTFTNSSENNSTTRYGNATIVNGTEVLTTVTVTFDVEDLESGVLHCFCSVGKNKILVINKTAKLCISFCWFYINFAL